MHRLYLLFLLFFQPIIFPSTTLEANILLEDETRIKLKEINQNLEMIYALMIKKKHKSICKYSLETAFIIERQMSQLKSIEPQHNWSEIKGALLDISQRYCRNGVSSSAQ